MGITGMGVNILFVDDGLDIEHPEFKGRYNPSGSVQDSLTNTAVHGTFSAGIAAAAANNGVCSVGVAPKATVSGAALEVDGGVPEAAFTVGVDNNINHVHSNSWAKYSCKDQQRRLSDDEEAQCPFADGSGPCKSESCQNQWSKEKPEDECTQNIQNYCNSEHGAHDTACADFWDLYVTCEHHGLPNRETSWLRKGVTEGRDGKGIIYVMAAGNNFMKGDNVNFQGWQNSIFTISVAAVALDGKHASYSSAGAAVLISAPGGETKINNGEMVSALWGDSGDCGIAGQGTSFSTPIVSGVVALMLESNRDLTWRDVQHILVATANSSQLDDKTFVTNGAGFRHSDLYGFGIVNAKRAVQLSKGWKKTDSFRQAVFAYEVFANAKISKKGVSSTADLKWPVNVGFIRSVEHVSVYVTTSGHGNRGDLEFTLTSPEGTPSRLTWQHNETGEDYVRFKFTTVRNWGEVATGAWELSVVDAKGNDNAGLFVSWILVIYGKCQHDAETCQFTTANMTHPMVWETNKSKMVAMEIITEADTAPERLSVATSLLMFSVLVWSSIMRVL